MEAHAAITPILILHRLTAQFPITLLLITFKLGKPLTVPA